MAKRNIITCELRASKDEDIAEVLNAMDERIQRSDVIRDALRAYLGLGGVVEPKHVEKGNQGNIKGVGGALLAGIQLTQKEKSAADMDDALDSLLNL